MFQKFGLLRIGHVLLLAVLLVCAKGAAAGPGTAVLTSGYDVSGQLGDGGTTSRATPFTITIGTTQPIIALAGGASHSLALAADGTVWAWGANNSGQLGDGTTTNRSTAVQVKLDSMTPLTGVVAIEGGDSHSLALTASGIVYAWGSDSSGQLGDGGTTQQTYPVAVSSISVIVAISANGFHSLALAGDGTVYAWGYNGYGQLGIGSKDTAVHSTPVAVPGLKNITAIAAGGYHSIALTPTGGVYSWGNNTFGQLGNGTTTQSSSPVLLMASAGVPITGVSALSAGVYHTVLIAGGTVLSVGYNQFGQLGDGTTTNRSYPVATTLTGVQFAIAGGYHTVAISAGKAYAWGQNTYGELGDGTTTNRTVPTAVLAIGTAQTIGAGNYQTLFLQGTAGTTVAAALTFDSISPVSLNQGVTLLFIPTDGSARFTQLASVPNSGVFTLLNVPAKNYQVWVKGTKYLADLVTLDAAVPSPVFTSLQAAGDGTNDNVVNTADFNLLVGAFSGDASIPGSGYDETADYDGDGVVNTTDFNLLVGNFGNSGAAIP